MIGLLPTWTATGSCTYLEVLHLPPQAADAISGEEDRIPYPRRLGQAFCALLEHLDPNKLPAARR